MIKLAEIINEAVQHSQDDVSFRASYSGRGMFGSSCVGVTGSQQSVMAVVADVIKRMANVLTEAVRGGNQDIIGDTEVWFADNVDILMDSQEDRMGYDVIIYWQQIESDAE